MCFAQIIKLVVMVKKVRVSRSYSLNYETAAPCVWVTTVMTHSFISVCVVIVTRRGKNGNVLTFEGFPSNLNKRVRTR